MKNALSTTADNIVLLTISASLLFSSQAVATTLFIDDFDGTSLDESVWRLPEGVGSLYGRTQIKPPEYGGRDLRPVVNDGSVILRFDTYNASAVTPGDTFWGHEIQTRQKFLPGEEGISIQTRMRFHGTPPGGLVAGFFTWGYDGTVRDEIDIEVLTNDLDGNRFLTNVYNDDSIGGAGDNAFVNVPGYDMTAWNTYEISWLPDRIQWSLNGQQVRERIVTVNGHPSEVRLNFAAPDAGFAAAYNGDLQPATSAGTNQQYLLEVDYVKVSSVVPLPPAIILFSSALALLSWVGRRRT